MERRKFIIGAGALATGSSAAVGTGAMTSQRANRNANIDITGDSNGTLQFSTHPASLENTEYVEEVNGQYTIQFDSDTLNLEDTRFDATGLNADSTYIFDNMFQITNVSQDALQVSFDESGLDNADAITFYMNGTDGKIDQERQKTSNAVAAGGGINVGVKIETPDNVPNDWETGSVAIVAEDLSDVGNN